ncbi:hypothetical protein MKW92_035996 [Papaver armeniacum]|nr:hypothetical protein MKW92_035996 [Papaver armeniacum]
MAIAGPITPGQHRSLIFDFVAGIIFPRIIPLFAATLYAEWLEYKKNSAFDINLVELDKNTSRTMTELFLLEGGNSIHLLQNYELFLMDESFLAENHLNWASVSVYFYICDRIDIFGESKRHQTEEWKGIVLMYHYFAATEIYNAIRIFIAAYMMWEALKFFCGICLHCPQINNSYMLVLHMPHAHPFTSHGLWCLCISNKYNEIGSVMALKMASCFLIVILVWEVLEYLNSYGAHLHFFLSHMPKLHRPVDAKGRFSSCMNVQFPPGLDHIWIIGYDLCLLSPKKGDGHTCIFVEKWMEKLEESEFRRWVSVVLIYIQADKITYNKYHLLYTWDPITTLYIETLVSRRSNSYTDGQPKLLLSLIPDYPMLNFICLHCYICCGIYAQDISYRLFELTNTLKTAFVPSKDDKRLMHNIVAAGAISISLYTLSFVFLQVPQLMG